MRSVQTQGDKQESSSRGAHSGVKAEVSFCEGNSTRNSSRSGATPCGAYQSLILLRSLPLTRPPARCVLMSPRPLPLAYLRCAC